MQNNIKTIDIILPSRIGDSILCLPALLCFKQLIEKFPVKNFKVKVFSTNKLTKIFNSLNLFEVKQFNNLTKLFSLFKPSNTVIFLEPSNGHIGFFGKKTYGINITGKKITYQNDMPYLYVERTANILPAELFDTLHDKYNLSRTSISYFGILLEIGFSVEEILECFNLNEGSLNFEQKTTNWKPKIDNYIVFCMEAAYGRKTDADRRFKEELYFEIADHIYEKYGLMSAFIGINNKIKLPNKNYIYDFRKKLSFEKLVQLVKYSKGYIGNDTGPLHLVNLLKKPSVGIYARERSMETYHPIFKNLNNMILGFPSIEYVDNFCDKLL